MKLNPIHLHQFTVTPPVHRRDLFIRELRISKVRGVFGVLSPAKSIHGGPTEIIAFHFSRGHATRAEAAAAAREYLHDCNP